MHGIFNPPGAPPALLFPAVLELTPGNHSAGIKAFDDEHAKPRYHDVVHMHCATASGQLDIIKNGVAAFFQPVGEDAAGPALSDIAPETGGCKKANDQYKRCDPE